MVLKLFSVLLDPNRSELIEELSLEGIKGTADQKCSFRKLEENFLHQSIES